MLFSERDSLVLTIPLYSWELSMHPLKNFKFYNFRVNFKLKNYRVHRVIHRPVLVIDSEPYTL
jgi:hypothetical protein